MLDVMRADEVVISLSVPSASSSSPSGLPPVVKSNDFFDVSVRIKNRLRESPSMLVSFTCSALD